MHPKRMTTKPNDRVRTIKPGHEIPRDQWLHKRRNTEGSFRIRHKIGQRQAPVSPDSQFSLLSPSNSLQYIIAVCVLSNCHSTSHSSTQVVINSCWIVPSHMIKAFSTAYNCFIFCLNTILITTATRPSCVTLDRRWHKSSGKIQNSRLLLCVENFHHR